MKKYIIIALSLLITSTSIAMAQTGGTTDDGMDNANGVNNSNTVSIPNPLVNIDTPQAFIGQIIKGLLGVVGTIALVMFVYGGFKWMTSMGNSKKVDEGKDTMLWATLGLIVIFSSYAMVKFVIDKVAG